MGQLLCAVAATGPRHGGPVWLSHRNTWVGSLDGITPNDLLSQIRFLVDSHRLPDRRGAADAGRCQYSAPLRETVTPYSMQWNFNIQRELPGQIVVEAAYVGTRGLQLSRNDESGLNLNQLDPKYMELGSRLNEQVDNPFYGIVNNGVLASPRSQPGSATGPVSAIHGCIPAVFSGSSSTYHALQVSFNKRFSRGLQFEGSYTKSKAIDNGMRHQNSYDIRRAKAWRNMTSLSDLSSATFMSFPLDGVAPSDRIGVIR